MASTHGVEPAPSSSHIATAAAMQALHVQLPGQLDPDGCWWCFRRWPCPDWTWSQRVLRLAREVRRGA